MGTIFKDGETEMNLPFSFIQQTAIRQLFCAKFLSKSRSRLALWNLQMSRRELHQSDGHGSECAGVTVIRATEDK